MYVKLFGGIALGTILGGGATYFLCNKRLKTVEHDKQVVIDTLNERIAKDKIFLENFQTEVDDLNLRIKRSEIIRTKLDTMYHETINAFCTISDVDMLADIGDTDIATRNNCLSKIDKAITEMKRLVDIDLNSITEDTDMDEITNSIQNNIDTMCDDIQEILEDYEDEEEELDEEDEVTETHPHTVSPKRIIVKSINGKHDKIFEIDGGEFEVLDGSDIENNDYCVLAQEVEPLYNFFFTTIKDQLKYHYYASIDPDAFDEMLEDLIITVSLSFIDDGVAVVTMVNAVIPFELFGEPLPNNKYRIYTIPESGVHVDRVISYFRGGNSDGYLQERNNSHDEDSVETKNESSEEEKPMVEYKPFKPGLNDETVEYVIENTGFNRESLKSFIGKLLILINANPDAGTAFKIAFFEIVEEIDILRMSEELDDSDRTRISTTLRALILNMKKNHGAEIKVYN